MVLHVALFQRPFQGLGKQDRVFDTKDGVRCPTPTHKAKLHVISIYTVSDHFLMTFDKPRYFSPSKALPLPLAGL